MVSTVSGGTCGTLSTASGGTASGGTLSGGTVSGGTESGGTESGGTLSTILRGLKILYQ